MTEPFPRLADALVEVSSRLHDISTELRALHGPVTEAAPAPQPQPQPAPHPAPHPWPAPQFAPGAPMPPYAPYYPPPAYGPRPVPYAPPRHTGSAAQPLAPYPTRVKPTGPTLWERLSREGAGARILAWAGGVVTLAGVVLMLVLAIQRGYIGPVPRLVLGGALGLVLVGIGLRVHSAAAAIGAHAVAATGVAVVYLDVVAATSYYHFLPTWAGLVVGLAAAAGGVAIAMRWNSEPFAVFVVVACAVSAPVLTRGFVGPLVGFLLVLQIAATPTLLHKRWARLGAVSAVPPVLAVLVQVAVASTRLHGSGHATSVTVLCVVVAAVQLLVATEFARRGQTELRDIATGLVLVAAVPALLSANLAGRYVGAALVASVAVLHALVWTAYRAGLLQVGNRFGNAVGAAAAVAAFEAISLSLSGDARALALLAAAALFALLATRTDQRAALAPSMLFGLTGLGLALEHAARPDRLTLAPFAPQTRAAVATMGTTGLLLAVTALVIAWAWARLDDRDPDLTRTRWIAAAVVALYGASAAVLSVGLSISPDEQGFRAGHVAVTVSWTVAALVLLLRHVDSTPLRVAGLSLVAAALAKLVLFDLSSLSGIPRVSAFLGAGLVLLAAGTRYAKLVAARTSTQLP